MGIPIWCLIAPIFLVSVRAGLHDVVAQSFYEEPQSSSPTPVPTQSQRPELIGMKEIVLFLTPEQVDTLQAAGAVVRPYPEYENDFAELQQQFQQSVEQQNVQRYQTWISPVEAQKDDRHIQNYYKLLNIQEINDDLTLETQSTEGTTEKATTTTPRYKYTKARQQYKDKEYSTPYVPKKARTKISNQSGNNAESYVRFLPNYEHEVLQMVPYQPLPISPYKFEDVQSMFLQANEDAQRNAYSQTDYMAQQIAFNVGNAEAPPNAFIVASTGAQQNAANIEAQNNAFIQATEAYRNTFSPANTVTQQNVFTQVSTEAYRNIFSQDNTVAQQNVFNQETAEAQQNSYAQNTAEAQRNAYSQAITEAQRNAFTQVNTEVQRNAYSQVTVEGQKSTNTQTNTEAIQNANSQETTEAQQNSFSQENIHGQQNAQSQTNLVAQQNTHSQANTDKKTAYRISITEAPQNAFSQVYTVTQQNAFSQANTVAQQTANNVENTEAPQIAYTQTNTSVQETAKTVANAEAVRNVYSQASTLAQQTANTVANTEAQPVAYTETSTKGQQTVYTEASTKPQQKTYSQINRENLRNLYKPSRPPRIQRPKGTKKPQGLEKATTPVTTPRPTGKTYVISQGTKEFKETLSSIEGLPPLLPLTPIIPLEEPQKQPVTPVTPAPPAPTVQTNILQQDKLSLLLAPLYQHQTITDTISRQKEELLKNEFNIRTKLQKMKETPQYYNQQEYTAELEKLTRNFGEQNALARIEASTSTLSPIPTSFVNQGAETTESRPTELVKNTRVPMLVRIPKPHEVKIPAPYPAPLEFIRVSRPIVGGRRPVEGVRNVYVKVDRPHTIPRYVPYIERQKIPLTIPITAEQLSIIRHIWEH